MKDQIGSDIAAAAVKTAPAVGMSVASAGGLLDPLGAAQMVVYVLTALLIIGQGAYLVWKWRREARSKPQ